MVGNEKRKVQDKKNNRGISFCALLTYRLGEVKSTRVKATGGEKKMIWMEKQGWIKQW